jgi:hypothetical protein
MTVYRKRLAVVRARSTAFLARFGVTRKRSQVASVVALLWLLVVPTTVYGQSGFNDVELVVGRHGQRPLRGESFDVAKGTLTSDVQAGVLRFESDRQESFEVPFDQVSSLRYEESRYPPRLFPGIGTLVAVYPVVGLPYSVAFRRSAPYLTIHCVSAAGEPAFEVLRLSSDLAPRLLEQLERDTGIEVDRSRTLTSFAGVPLHVGIGDSVFLTDDSGRKVSGRVTELSPTAIVLDGSRQFEQASVRRIEVNDSIWNVAIPYAVAAGVAMPLWVGAAGALV